MAERLAHLIARFRRQLLAVWFVALGAAGLVAPSLPGLLSGGGWDVPGAQSQITASAMQTGFASRGASNLTVVVRDDRYPAGSAQFDRRIEMVVREVSLDPRLKVSGTYGWAALSQPVRNQFVGRNHCTAITLLAQGAVTADAE